MAENENNNRTNMQNVVLGILAVAVVVLYILHFAGCNKNSQKEEPAAAAEQTEEAVADSTENSVEAPAEETADTDEDVASNDGPADSPIAYVNVDTLLSKYELAKEMNAQLLKKQKAAQSQLEAKATQLQTDYANIQQKYQKALISESEAQAEAQKLQKQQAELQELDARLTKQMVDEQQKMNKQLLDKIQKFFKEYNKTKQYKAILSNASNDNILYAESSLNITNDVIKKLNAEYKKKK